MWCWGKEERSVRLTTPGLLSLSIFCLFGLSGMSNANEFGVGQVWTFKDADLSTSRVIIGRIDRFSDGVMVLVSVAVTDAPIATTDAPTQTIPHLPFEAEALKASVVALDGEREVPKAFDEGYRIWRKAYDGGNAGAFTIPVASAVEYVKTTVERGRRKARSSEE